MRYLTYARKSTESEDRQVQSLDDQLTAMRELSERYGLTVPDELSEARSAKAPGQRPVFSEMLNRIKRGEADGILCWSINRLFRNSVDYGEVAWLLQQGIIKSIRTVDREYLPDDNVLLMAVEAGVATQYVIDLRKATIRGLTSKAEKGWFPGKAPPGYVNNKLSHEIEPDGPRFDLVRRAWEMLLTGAYTVPQVHEQLLNWGFPRIARSTLYLVFSNPFYTGRFRYRGETLLGNHRKMVTLGEFDRIQALLHRPAHIQPQKREFAFTGLIRCGVCGCLVTAEQREKRLRTTGKTAVYVYYHCSGAKGCSKAGVREELLEHEIGRLLRQCAIAPEFSDGLEEMVKRHNRTHPDAIRATEEQLRRSLAQTNHKLQTLTDLRLGGEIGADEFKEHRCRLQDEISRAETSLAELTSAEALVDESLVSYVRFAGRACRMFSGGTVRTRRLIATVLSERYILTRGELKIKPNPLIERIRTFEPPKRPSDMVRRGPGGPASPTLLRWLDNIRTFIRESNITFRFELPDHEKPVA